VRNRDKQRFCRKARNCRRRHTRTVGRKRMSRNQEAVTMFIVMEETEYEMYLEMLDNGIAKTEAIKQIQGKEDLEVWIR